ncbi:MAG TPA: AbrB/MazE/SpoVT family DNA-binding domain-containing protein [Verrucomicrobiae bacterium]|jgi:AbrB family looped-hinge helix DNA binding protein
MLAKTFNYDVASTKMNTVIQDDGAIKIPAEVRQKLDLRAGTILELTVEGGSLLAWKKVEPDAFEKWRGRGHLPAGLTTDEYLRMVRDDNSR